MKDTMKPSDIQDILITHSRLLAVMEEELAAIRLRLRAIEVRETYQQMVNDDDS